MFGNLNVGVFVPLLVDCVLIVFDLLCLTLLSVAGSAIYFGIIFF
jgi:hypothetical protein